MDFITTDIITGRKAVAYKNLSLVLNLLRNYKIGLVLTPNSFQPKLTYSTKSLTQIVAVTSLDSLLLSYERVNLRRYINDTVKFEQVFDQMMIRI